MKENKIKYKRIIIILSIVLVLAILLFIGIFIYLKNRYEERPLELNNFYVEVYDEVKLSELIKDDITLEEDFVIDSLKVKDIEKEIKYRIDDDKYKTTINIHVVDTTPPTIFSGTNITVYTNSDVNLKTKIIAGDNYDDTPTREIIGNYDLTKVGTYNLKYVITDSSGNSTNKYFKLKVKDKPKNTYSSSTTVSKGKTDFSEYIKKYKTNNTKLGIDVSKWQGDIDFHKVKEAGCEFVIIRLGYQKGINGDMIVDPYFTKNIKAAKKEGLLVGVYIYTYASSKEDAIKQADWARKSLEDYEIDLGISYDWEEFRLFSKLNLSYYHFTEVANTFLDYLDKYNLAGMLYSSKYYLENIWTKTNHDVWLAHYTSKTTYKGKYKMWQLSSSGKIDGIKGAVDIDIMYN